MKIFKLTLVLPSDALFLLQFAALLLLPLSQHFSLEASNRVEQFVTPDLRGRQHHAAVQKPVDGRQQVLSVVCLVCGFVEVLSEDIKQTFAF